MGHFHSDEQAPQPADRMHQGTATALAECPIIAAVNLPETFTESLRSPCRAIYLLTGSPLSLPPMLREAREHGKLCLVNIDFLDGLSRDRFAVKYLAEMEPPVLFPRTLKCW